MKTLLIYFTTIVLTLVSVSACNGQQMKNDSVSDRDTFIIKMVNEMTLSQKAGQVLMPAIPGVRLTKKTKEMLHKYKPGGIIFFGYNVKSAPEIKQFTGQLQSESLLSSGIPLFISIDQEGGRVYRVRDGATLFPGNMAAGMAGDNQLTYKWGRIIGLQLRQLGINMNLAPVLDVSNNPDNPVINSRSFGSDPHLVARLGAHYIKGLQQSRCIAVGKHFPGHGDTNKDSHKTLPVIRYKLERLQKIEFVPFIEAVKSGVAGIMTAHIAYPNILGSMKTATESKYFLHDVLRKQMGHNGLVITDDLEMNAISKRQNIGRAAVNSINAGVDIVLISTYKKNLPLIHRSIIEAVRSKELPVERLNAAVAKIIAMKLKYNIMQKAENGVVPGKFKLTEADKSILNEAPEVNKALSRQAIYYYGDRSLVSDRSNKRYFFISSSARMRSAVGQNGITSLSHYSQLSNVKMTGKKERVLFAHLGKKEQKLAHKLMVYCNKNKIKLIGVSTDNPYLLVRMGTFDSMLFSFSNTPESIWQLGRCINGEFEPNYNSTLQLGVSQ